LFEASIGVRQRQHGERGRRVAHELRRL
jgi:hypothetical protein